MQYAVAVLVDIDGIPVFAMAITIEVGAVGMVLERLVRVFIRLEHWHFDFHRRVPLRRLRGDVLGV